MADHQVAHIYIQDESLTAQVRKLLESVEGLDGIWGAEEKAMNGIDHGRSGDLVVFCPMCGYTSQAWLRSCRVVSRSCFDVSKVEDRLATASKEIRISDAHGCNSIGCQSGEGFTWNSSIR